jgi:hypothetical protein
VTHRRVAVKIERARGLENPLQLDYPRSHIDEIRHGIVLAKQRAEGGQCVGDTQRHSTAYVLLILLIGDRSPPPGVIERLDLGAAAAVISG